MKENREGRDQDSTAVERHENRWGQEIADVSTDEAISAPDVPQSSPK